MDQKVEQRIFRKFSQWYYIDAKKSMPIPDAPELVALLLTIGFKLNNMGFSQNAKHCSSNSLANVKVTIECGSSGIVAEMSAPEGSACRCSVFSEREEAKEQASFWTITTSQEKVNSANAIGSSLLPDIEGHRAVVIKEIFHLLQDELFELPHGAKASAKRRQSMPPVPKFEDNSSGASSSSIQRSVDSIDCKVEPGTESQTEGLSAAATISLNRRASFGCGEDLKHVRPLPARLPAKPKNLLAGSSSSLVQDDVISKPPLDASNYGLPNKCDALKGLLKAALDLLEPKKKPPLERKATFDVPLDVDGDSAVKRPKIVCTPGPSISKSAAAGTFRVATPNPAAAMSAFRTATPNAAAARAQKTPLSRMPANTPMPSVAASKARTGEILRRRTFVVSSGEHRASGRVSRGGVLSPSVEAAESNVNVVTPIQKARMAKRASLPPRPTFTKENRPT